MIRLRAAVVLPLALVVALFAVRASIFESPADHPLRQLQSSFASHPAALIDSAMRDIGSAASKSQAMPASAEHAMLQAARKAPLAPEPFLVGGTMAQMAGDDGGAEAMFMAARLRNPRAPAARYFLADRFLRTNRIAAGLDEMAALAKLSEHAATPFAPALAAYARSPGAIPQLRRFFAGAPATRDMTLELLSQDPANTELVLALAPPLPLHQSPSPSWPAILVQGLVTAHNYGPAEALWQRINGVERRGLLYDPQFRDQSAAPPFNWRLSSGSAGVAEASGAGGLDIIYYGREETVFAAQMIRLDPGSYRLAMRVEAPVSASGMAWFVTCAAGDSQGLLQLPLEAAQKGVLAAGFTVPAGNCPVQWIALRGKPGDSSDTAQVTISDLALNAAPAR